MEQPTEKHHLKDLGNAEETDPTAEDAVELGSDVAPSPSPDAPPAPETLAGRVGLEGSADSPTGDDRFTGGSR
ncbi:hypothetical protein C4K88_03750 [Arthrobacter pityocampae]|uniref:Uncharacterized protein n=1 Tax=Arthrobacter pityocampae TaxID=547334 RepID=A0A2S5J2G0_9MICC|nr:hypothetical protein [Arthrobacter pityocampae]PPB50977.1 hypothetical protein C4K88_03750 [Arthrobacter pityocampae]